MTWKINLLKTNWYWFRTGFAHVVEGRCHSRAKNTTVSMTAVNFSALALPAAAALFLPTPVFAKAVGSSIA
jgi:hypothetical protein